MNRSQTIFVVLFLGLGLSLSSCDTSKLFGNSSTPALVTNVTSVTVAPLTASVAVNATVQLTATVLPANATYPNVTWASSVPTCATVSDKGLVAAVAAGVTTVTVTSQDGLKSATSVITVTP